MIKRMRVALENLVLWHEKRHTGVFGPGGSDHLTKAVVEARVVLGMSPWTPVEELEQGRQLYGWWHHPELGQETGTYFVDLAPDYGFTHYAPCEPPEPPEEESDSVFEDRLRQMMRDPRYWRDSDPSFVERVREGFRRLYPDESR